MCNLYDKYRYNSALSDGLEVSAGCCMSLNDVLMECQPTDGTVHRVRGVARVGGVGGVGGGGGGGGGGV